MEHYNSIILPIALLFLSFVLKLTIDRSVETPAAIKALCELPVDMIFLSISFIVAFTISSSENDIGLFWCFVFVIAAVGIVYAWRRSIKFYEGKKRWFFWFVPNILIASVCLFFSVQLLESKSDSNSQEEKQELIEDKR